VYSAGLFEWPRQSTGQELAERLGISPPTFNQHLRAAERLVFEEVFTDDSDESPVTEE
jgi:predicted DNA binding protein